MAADDVSVPAYNDPQPQKYTLSKRASEINPSASEHPEIGFVFADEKGNVKDLQRAVVDTRVAPKGQLVIWLMGYSSELFDRIASYGLHGIQVHYANGWFGLIDRKARDSGAALGDIRLEAATGDDHSPHVDIPKPDGMTQRALQFVKWLAIEHPQGNWNQFLTDDGNSLRWEKVIVSGSSHGSTTAARFAKHQKVNRVVMFCGPRDQLETWQALPSATPANRFFGFSHVLDGGWTGDHYCRSWEMLGLHQFGPIVNVDQAEAPFGNTRRLITDADVGNNSNRAHSSVVPGRAAVKDGNGKYIHEDVWRYLYTHPVDETGTAVPADPQCGEDLPAKSLSSAKVGPWDIEMLKNTVPSMTWLRRDQPVHSLLYAGEHYKGKPTEVFAFYASPATLGDATAQGKFPGVVLIHGGGGTAFADWVHLWAKRGYAAIAMDLAGYRPPDPVFDDKTMAPIGHQSDGKFRTRLSNGGPFHSHTEKFDAVGGDFSDDWPYHAAASVIRAHNLLRSFPEVDAERTAVTGISWGGYTTCLVASLDDRFKAAVPVYGCGFLHEGESVQKPSIDGLGDRKDDWVRLYDSGSLLPRCRVPILFVNGTNDVHYPLDSYMKSFNVVAGPKEIRVTVKMPHGHPPGWAPQEIGLFIDSHCRGGTPLPVPGTPTNDGDSVRVSYTSRTALKNAQLHYTTDTGLRSQRQWTSVPATITPNAVIAPQPPAEANTWFLTLTDERDATVSTTVQFQ